MNALIKPDDGLNSWDFQLVDKTDGPVDSVHVTRVWPAQEDTGRQRPNPRRWLPPVVPQNNRLRSSYNNNLLKREVMTVPEIKHLQHFDFS